MAQLKDYASVARAPFLLLPPTLVASGAAAAAIEHSARSTRYQVTAHIPVRFCEERQGSPQGVVGGGLHRDQRAVRFERGGAGVGSKPTAHARPITSLWDTHGTLALNLVQHAPTIPIKAAVPNVRDSGWLPCCRVLGVVDVCCCK